MTERTKIPDDVAAEVLYAADRTCCVCRVLGQKVQIHHIDGDPTNNARQNLTAICLNCHSEAHTNHAFGRNLSPDLLRLYDSSWRELVRLRLDPDQDPDHVREYGKEAALELCLACHAWKNAYILLHQADFLPAGEKEGLGIWEVLAQGGNQEYTREQWQQYLPLFERFYDELRRDIMESLSAHGSALSPSIRTKAIRVLRQVSTQRSIYLAFPQVLAHLGPDVTAAFRGLFQATARALGDLCAAAETTEETMWRHRLTRV